MKVLLLLLFALNCVILKGQWQQCTLFGGNIYSIASKDSNIFAGLLSGGGLYQSSNNGVIWSKINDQLLQNKSIYCIGINGNDIYIGLEAEGIIKSNDNGNNWTSMNNGLPIAGSGYSPKVILFKDSLVFIASSDSPGGIYLSSDNGNTWNSVNNGLIDTDIKCIASDNLAVFAGTGSGGGIYKTNSNGSNWTSINTGLPSGWFSVNTLLIDDTVIYAGINTSNINSIYKTSNGGITWSQCSNNIGSYITSMVKIGNQLLLGTTNGMFISNDGINWNTFNIGIENTNINSLCINNQEVYAATLIGIYKKSNNQWFSLNNGINAFSITSIKNIGQSLFIGEKSTGIFATTDYGYTWACRNNGLTDLQITTLLADGNNVFAGTYNGVYKTSNFGNSWLPIFSLSGSYYAINTIVKSGSVIYIGSSQGIQRSLDNGFSWFASNTGLPSVDVRGIVISNYGNLYTAVQDAGVFFSPNNGSIWGSISTSFYGLNYVNCISTSLDYIIAGLGSFNPPIVFSNNNGVTWQIGNNSLFGHSLYALETIGNRVFAGVNDGLFYSKNNGVDWINISDNLPLTSVISIGRDDSCLYVGVYKNGIWKRPLSDFGLDFTEYLFKDIQSKIKVFPNPANEILFIELEENATLEIINIQGQIVDSNSLIEKVNNLDISNLGSGVYTLRIKTDRGIAMRKLIKQ
jgi:photosystem II stability/assembly factor-like uncharacterized protein